MSMYGFPSVPGYNPGTWRSGSGSPSNTLGIDGDYYLNTVDGGVYLRTASVYSLVGNIKENGGGVLGGVNVSRWIASPRYYLLSDANGTNAAGGLSIDTLYAVPFTMTQTRTLDRLGIYVHTIGASGVARFGIYDTHSDGGPNNLLVDGGQVTTGTTGIKEVTVNVTLPAGQYWRVLVLGTTACQVQCTGNTAEAVARFGFASIGQTTPLLFSKSFTYAALPSAWPAGTGTIVESSVPAIWARFSA